MRLGSGRAEFGRPESGVMASSTTTSLAKMERGTTSGSAMRATASGPTATARRSTRPLTDSVECGGLKKTMLALGERERPAGLPVELYPLLAANVSTMMPSELETAGRQYCRPVERLCGGSAGRSEARAGAKYRNLCEITISPHPPSSLSSTTRPLLACCGWKRRPSPRYADSARPRRARRQ